MKYLNPFETHGLKPFPVPGYESQQIPEPVEDDVEELRERILTQATEPICEACDLGGCMVKGLKHD